MKTNSLVFIGGGRITRIFLQAFKNKSVDFDSIVIFDTNHEILEDLQRQFPAVTLANDLNQCTKQGLIILAIHPPVMAETLKNMKGGIDEKSVILSLAPKFSIAKMGEILLFNKIVRMIPNATSFCNKGYNPVHFHKSFNLEEKEELMKLFRVLGRAFEVAEHKLEGYAIVSAMLPTYFWFQWQKLEEIAVKTGLSHDEAINTVYETLKTSNELFYRSELSHEEVMDLIPVKPIGEHEIEINDMYDTKLMGLFEKIRSIAEAEVV